jgi:hypothetical protein
MSTNVNAIGNIHPPPPLKKEVLQINKLAKTYFCSCYDCSFHENLYLLYVNLSDKIAHDVNGGMTQAFWALNQNPRPEIKQVLPFLI